MNWKIYYIEDAKLDIKEAKGWYAQKQITLGDRFVNQVKSALITLKSNPLQYQIKYKNIRIKYTDVFPFGIHYYLEEESKKIIIIAVLHNRQNLETSINRV